MKRVPSTRTQLESLDTKTLKKLEEFMSGYEKIRQLFLNTKGHKKLLNYFLGISDTDSFRSKIKELREKYDIPPEGLPLDLSSYEEIPEKWYRTTKETVKWQEFDKDTKKLFKNYSLNNEWMGVILSYLFYNKFVIEGAGNQFSMFRALDVDSEKNIIPEINTTLFPVAIFLSPYASKRDLMEFIEKTYSPFILPMQKRHQNKKIMIGKFRTKKPILRARNRWIYENRNLSLKKIRGLLAEEKIFLDDGHIGKIISLEAKKRKEV